nr:glycoprotein vIgFam2.3 [Elephant endotheliotropic herpesvirus 1A]
MILAHRFTGGAYYILLYLCLLVCVDCVVQKVSINGEATIILSQRPDHSTFSWSHYNETIINGSVSLARSCNSTKYITRLPYNQCCDLTITNVQISDLGNYTLRVSFASGESTEETVVLVSNSSSAVTVLVTKATIISTSNMNNHNRQKLQNVAYKCNLCFSGLIYYVFVFLIFRF